MAVSGKPKGGFAGSFERELLKARKKAGRKIGGIVTRERRRVLGKVDPRRKKAVRSLVGRGGELVILDHAPLAEAQETGKTIRPKSGDALLVRTGESYRKGVKMYRSKDGKYLFQGAGKEKKLLGVYRKEIVIKARPEHERLQKIAEKQLDRYRDEIDKNLTEG